MWQPRWCRVEAADDPCGGRASRDRRGRSRRDADARRFVSSDELLALHATNSAMRDNDHFHNGAGFLAQHLRLDQMVLDSVQAVDAGVVTPYWDWTIESKAVADGSLASPFDTPLWSKEWFGSMNYANDPAIVGPHYALSLDEFFGRGFEAWAIRDGRWAFTKVKHFAPGDEAKADVPTNSYGYLRAPWNNNPSPYVTRVNFRYKEGTPAKSWPTCTDLYAFLAPDSTALRFLTHLEDMDVHAAIHYALGGTVMDVRKTEALVDAFTNVGSSAASCYQTVSERHLWRAHLSDMAETCDPTAAKTHETLDTCQLTCGEGKPADLLNVGKFAAEHYSCARLTSGDDVAGSDFAPDENTDEDPVAEEIEEIKETHTDAQIGDLGKAVCGTTFLKGEHLEASGTTDPSFFVVHPTLARYYQMKRLMGEAAYVDDWAKAEEDPKLACLPATGSCFSDKGVVSEAADCCAGHLPSSTYFLNSNRDVARTARTNAEIVDAASPHNARPDGLVFHHFRFEHCDEDFSSLLRGERPAVVASRKARSSAMMA